MQALLLPLEWFLDLLNVIVNWEVISGVTFGGISLAILSIICIFRFIVFPLIGGSVPAASRNTKNKERK